MLVSVGLGLAGLYARAFRWRWLFPPGPEPPGIVPATMIGYMANNVLPLRAGEFVRLHTGGRYEELSAQARRRRMIANAVVIGSTAAVLAMAVLFNALLSR